MNKDGRRLWIALTVHAIAGSLGAGPAMGGTEITLTCVDAQAEEGFVEIRGVGAGAFDPEAWEEGNLHWVPDVRSPLYARYQS